MEKITNYSYTHRVSYYETDQMGIVHNSNYFRWFEDARVDFLERVGFSYARMEELGIMIPVLSTACEYKVSARFGDYITVIPKIAEFNGFKMTVLYRVVRSEDGVLLAQGETRHCFTDTNLKPVRTKREYPDIYEVFNSYTGVEFTTE